MSADGWHLNEDIDLFLARAGEFLRSRPALHTMHLSVTEKLRGLDQVAYHARGPVLGWLEQSGTVRATFYRLPPRGLNVTSLDPGQADALTEWLVASGQEPPSVTADHATASAFAHSWQRRTGMTPTLRVRLRLYRLGTLTPPQPVPAGRARSAGEQDLEHLMSWCRELAADLGEDVTINAGSWAGTRFAEKRFIFWETPDGTPVSMAGANPMVAGQVRVDPVYTPARLRGRGYAGAVTVEVSRAALDEGATDVVLFTDAANPTSNALYERIGYRHIADFATYDLGYSASGEGRADWKPRPWAGMPATSYLSSDSHRSGGRVTPRLRRRR